MKSPLLHYTAISTFKREFYRDLLTEEHLKGGQVHIDTMSFTDGQKDVEANFWGWVLEKNGVKYLLPSTGADGSEIKLRELLPLMAKQSMKVANRGVVYNLIQEPIPVRFRPIKTMSFRELVDRFSCFAHSNAQHQKLAWFMGLSQVLDRANYRISTPAGFGKDSIVDTLGNLVGKCATIESPTLAKLEERSVNLKWLAINEVVDLTKDAWKVIEQFLLAAGAHKPTVTKHSRAFGGVGEELDISEFSLSIMYNDIDHYPESDKYLDFVAKDAVLDRFPAFRLYGTFTENFNDIRSVDVEDFVKQHRQDYVDMLYAFTYYKQNLSKELHGYNISTLMDLPERWRTNIGRLLKIVDLYCESQEEFESWITVINKSLQDYKDMLSYPAALEKASKKFSKKEVGELLESLKRVPTFTERVNLLNRGEGVPSAYTDATARGFW